MYFNIKNKIFIHKAFLLLPFLFLSSSSAKGYLFTLLFAFMHECAHLAAALICKEKVKRIFIMPYGFELRINMPEMKNELFISASGPFFSLFLALFFLIITQKEFFCTNFFLFLLNILPAVPLDGGRILKLTLWKRCGAIKGNSYLRIISMVISALFAVFGIVFLNIWLLVISAIIYLKCRTLSASPFYKKRTFPTPRKNFRVTSDTPVMSLLHRFSPYYTATFTDSISGTVISEEDIIFSLVNGNYTAFGDLLTAKSSR